MGWVDPWVGLGWVGLGWIEFSGFFVGWVGSSLVVLMFIFNVVIILQHKKCIFTLFTRLKCCCLNSNVFV